MFPASSNPFTRAAGMIAASVILLACPCAAQVKQEPPPLISDRPDFTESSNAVPRGLLQIESGFTFTNDSSGFRLFNAPETLLRWGAGHRSEWRLGLPDVLAQRRVGRRTGFGDAYLGFKRELGHVKGFEAAFVPGVSLPTGSAGIGTGGLDPEMLLTWAAPLGGPWSISGQFGAAWFRNETKRSFNWAPTVSVGRSLGGRWTSFVEYAGSFTGGDSEVHLLHHGYLYSLTPNSQLDVHGGFGLSRDAPDFFIGAGIVVRF